MVGAATPRRRSSRIWHPAVLVKTRVWVGGVHSLASSKKTPLVARDVVFSKSGA